MSMLQTYEGLNWTDFIVAPWIGKQVSSSPLFPNKRILALGHSTYITPEFDHLRSEEEQIRSWLIQDTEKARAGNSPSRFWTNIMNITMDAPSGELRPEQQAAFWDSIALYNYIQRIQLPGRHQAEDPDYDQAFGKFKVLLERLKPTHVLVFSADVFDHLAEAFEKPDGTEFEHEFNGSTIKFLRLRHPSWPISRPKWAPIVAKFLNS